MQTILKWIDELPWVPLLIMGGFLALAPFSPPHLVEKTQMLVNGQLTRPLDIFDLLYHLLPLAVMGIKYKRQRAPKP